MESEKVWKKTAAKRLKEALWQLTKKILTFTR